MSENIMNTIRNIAEEARNIAEEEREDIICVHCGRVIDTEEEEVALWEDGEPYCSDCVHVCEHCGELIPFDAAIHVNATIRWLPTRVYCQDCADNHAFQCRDCDEWFTEDGIWDYYDGEPVCHDCEANDHYVRCATCGVIMYRDDARYDEDRDDYYCDDHYHPQTRHLHGYGHLQVSSNDTTRFLTMPEESNVKLHYGIELEIDKGDDRDDCVEDLYAVSDNERLFMCKTDGSLDDGVEIVSNPMSFDYAMQKFPFDEISAAARNNGFRSHDAGTCGLHIHVSRVGLGNSDYERDLTAAKLMLLFDRFWQKMIKFSRRGSYQIERWSQQTGVFYTGIERESDEEIVRKAKDKAWNAGRYQAINIQNRHTIEFRLFRGTLNVSTIRATIQFVKVAIDFAMRTPLKDVITASWEDFVRSDYAELNEYLQRRGLLDACLVQDSGNDEDGNE